MRKVTMAAVLVALVAAGCGGGGGSSSGVGNFVGSWVYTAGSITQACTGSAAEVMDLTGYNVSITRSNVVGEILYSTDFDDYGCTRALEVVGNTASFYSASNCTDRATDPSFGPYSLLIAPFAETLTYRGGGVMTESANNSLTYTYDDGVVLGCTSTISNASLGLLR